MIHYMNLNNEPFEMIDKGLKTIELRLYDEKRRLIKINDYIIFSNINNSNLKIKTVVKNIYIFNNFKELYENLPLLKCGYTLDNVNNASYLDMEAYYSKKLQDKYQVVGIEIEKSDI